MIGSDAIKEVLQTNPHTYPFRWKASLFQHTSLRSLPII
jgi:hypothetical protein